ncbi:hypothetical protein ACK2FW_13145 [Clostridioides difficile]
MTKDKKGTKEILSIQCVKDFSYNAKLSEEDKFIMAIYNIYRSLIHIEISEKEFLEKLKKYLIKVKEM